MCMQIYGLKHAQTLDSIDQQDMKMFFCAGVYLSLHATTTCGQKLIHVYTDAEESVRAK